MRHEPFWCAVNDKALARGMDVQISLICLFRSLDLDMLVAAHTAPQKSYQNPVELVMSLINLGLQSIGVMHQKMS